MCAAKERRVSLSLSKKYEKARVWLLTKYEVRCVVALRKFSCFVRLDWLAGWHSGLSQ